MDTSTERDWVRELAGQVARMAAEPRMEAIRQRWRDVNALRQPDRAPVWCRPVGCWRELLPEDSLRCTDPWLRELEYSLRQTLVKRDIDDDTPVEEYLAVPAIFRREPQNTWGVDIGRHRTETDGGSWAYDPPLEDADDFAALRCPAFTYAPDESRQNLERAEELLDGVMPVQLVVAPPLGATLGTAAADLRGLSQLMLDMAAAPELVHRLMALLRDATLAAMDEAEATGLLTPNNIGPMNCSDPIGAKPPDGKLSCADLWCMANAQEFDQVSPPMWEEFGLDYQKPIFERFGLVGYGCCENLTHKLAGVVSIPNLRIITCSAWTDLTAVLAAAGRDYCIMWRQKASDVVFPDDTNRIRQDLRDGARQLRGSSYQIVLRELQTLSGHPDRLHVWTRYAREAAEKYA